MYIHLFGYGIYLDFKRTEGADKKESTKALMASYPGLFKIAPMTIARRANDF